MCAKYIEIKNKMTVTKGEVGGDNRGKGGSVFRKCIKDTWRTLRGVGSGEGGGDGWDGGVVGGEWRQLYLDNNKNNKIK